MLALQYFYSTHKTCARLAGGWLMYSKNDIWGSIFLIIAKGNISLMIWSPDRKLKSLTFHTRVKDAEACPIGIAIHGCQVIHIEINWCITWTIVCWSWFGKQTKAGGWFAFQTKGHDGFPSILWSKFHISLK